ETTIMSETVVRSSSPEVGPPWVLAFAEVDRTRLALVGGKGANLGEMTRAGFPVPPGFCVTAAAYRRFLAGHPNPDGLVASPHPQARSPPPAALVPGPVEAVPRPAGAVRQALPRLPIPAPVEEAVLAAWDQLGGDAVCAVRSSATAEDLPHASFAGQQETYL